ncbi:MAG: response regulator [Xenococcaceae cyanobacterium MO_167.B52]|nr:response regulator [Xenococcaceae cyanobacterium MO_167.B52]
MNPINIFIVEGELTTAKSLALDLEQAGYKVVGMVKSGVKALQKIPETNPDLILIEIALPGDMDGITTSQKIQTEYKIPLIYLTSLSDKATLKRARTTNPKGYILKPYKLEDLKIIIDSTCHNQQALKIYWQKLQRKAKLANYKVKKIAHQTLKIPSFSDLNRRLQRDKYQQYLPKLSPEDANIVSILQQEGVYVTSLAEFKLPHTKRLLKEMIMLYPHLYTLSHLKNWQVGIPSSRKFFYTEILLWGLEERLLNIIENYIGLPLLFQGADLRRDIANGSVKGVRQWHLDIDDERMVKVIVYLNNVGNSGGPYEYIPRSWTRDIAKSCNYTSGFVNDNEIAEIVPFDGWKTCAAEAGTIIITDPCNVFHRAKPAKRSRYSITFGYTSRFPKVSLSEFKLSAAQWQRLNPSLSQRQISCLK